MDCVDKIKKGRARLRRGFPATRTRCQGPSQRGRQGVTMDKEHALHRPQDGRSRRVAPRPGAQARHPDQKLALRRKVRRRRLPSRDRRLHAQTGDPTAPASGGMGEFARGRVQQGAARARSVSMARTSDPNCHASQFFICFKDSNFLDGQYTVWARSPRHGVRRQDQEGRAASNPTR